MILAHCFYEIELNLCNQGCTQELIYTCYDDSEPLALKTYEDSSGPGNYGKGDMKKHEASFQPGSLPHQLSPHRGPGHAHTHRKQFVRQILTQICPPIDDYCFFYLL